MYMTFEEAKVCLQRTQCKGCKYHETEDCCQETANSMGALAIEYLLVKIKESEVQGKTREPAIEQEPRCKNCKWWKDSDGEYRRDYEAESLCPINTFTVYKGEGYCYLFSPKAESENK